MRRRLPLMEAVAPPKPPVPLVAPTAAAWAVGIADSVEGEDSFAFAEEFAAELRRAQVPVRIALLAYEARPVPPVRVPVGAGAEPHGAAISTHAVSVQGGLLPPLVEVEGTVTLLVGGPALGSFAPALAVLLGSERGVTSTPPFLRALRDRVHLALATPRAGLATLLARQLLACGFLPRA